MPYQRIVFNLQGGVRREKMGGRDYVVAPAAILAEDVITGSAGPVYYPGTEIAESVPLWNHKPIVVYHPTDDQGAPISACNPSVLDARGIGMMLNARYDDKLRAECWVDEERAKSVDARILTALNDGKQVEVSTGLFMDLETKAGVHNGKDYSGIVRRYKPDHLAALPDKVGAYSIAQGGGMLTVNQGREPERTQQVLTRSMEAALRPLGAKIVNNELSFGDIHRQLSDLLANKYGEPGKYWPGHVEEVYKDRCVFCKSYSYEGGDTRYMIKYKLNKGDAVALVGEAEEVVRKTEYVTANETLVADGAGGLTPKVEDRPVAFDKKAHVSALIANGVYAEADRATLEGLPDPIVEKIPAVKATPAAAPPNPPPPTNNAGQQPQPALTKEQYIANAPPGIREVLQDSLNMVAQERERLIANIQKSPRNVFTPEYLKHESRTIQELRGLAALAGIDVQNSADNPPMFLNGQAPLPNYGGAGGGAPAVNQAAVTAPPLPAVEMDFPSAYAK
jgi:hypothetical protein